MATGLSPKYHINYQLNAQEQENFLVIAAEAAQRLGWKLKYISEEGWMAQTKFSWRSWSEEVWVNLNENKVQIKSMCTGGQLMDWGKNKSNIEVLLNEIDALKEAYTAEEWLEKWSRLNQEIPTASAGVFDENDTKSESKITSFLSIFTPSEVYFVAPILININILMFLIMVFTGTDLIAPTGEDLIQWGANFTPKTLDGGWWRLLISCFLHIGILHLILNLYALMYIGIMLEPFLGKARFLSAYLLAGVAASVSSLWWHDLSISAGASGAIFGMYGVFLALLTTKLLGQTDQKALLTSTAVFVGYNLLYGLKAESNVDNAAHIGGLVSGLIIGYALVPSLIQAENKVLRYVSIGALSLVLLVSSFSVYKSIPNNFGLYDQEMNRFFTLESMALEVYNLPNGTPKEKILMELKDRGLYYWEENLRILRRIKQVKLPNHIQERNDILIKYCKLRIACYELLYKSLLDNTQQYDEEIESYSQQINDVLDEFKDKS